MSPHQTLNFRRYGTPGAPTLVLLHGFLGSSGYWLPTVIELRRYFDIIALSTREPVCGLSVVAKRRGEAENPHFGAMRRPTSCMGRAP